MRTRRALTNIELRSLASARDHGDPRIKLDGYERLMFPWTYCALVSRGLLDFDGKITTAGRTALRNSEKRHA